MSEHEILDSWKEISSYLKRDIRTCQRWEKVLDLPVHRLDGTPRARVFAYKDELEAWLVKKSLEHERRRRRSLAAISAGVVLVLAGYFLWRSVLRPPALPLPSPKPTLAFFSFKNNSGIAALDIWKENLPTLLAGGLGQSRYLRVLGDPNVYGALKRLNLEDHDKYTAEELRTIAAECGATHLLCGSYFETGGKFITSVSLVDGRTGDALAPIEEKAQSRDAIIGSIDGLVKKVKAALRIPAHALDEDLYKMVGEVYTKNLQALEHYFEATGFYRNGEHEKAIVSYNAATDLDPQFAMAYVKLSAIYGELGDYLKKDQCLTKAYQLKDRLPEKDRLIVEGNMSMLREKTIPKAVDILRKAVEKYPDDFQSGMDLALALDWVSMDLRIKEYQRMISSQDQTQLNSVVANLLCFVGEYSRAREYYETFLKTLPPGARPKHSLGWFLLLEKRRDAALREFEKGVAVAPDDPGQKRYIAAYYALTDDSRRSQGILEGLCGSPKEPASLDDDFINLDLFEGKLRDALNKVEESEKNEGSGAKIGLGRASVDVAPPYLRRGSLYLQAGQPLRALEEFRKALEIVEEEEDRVHDKGYTILAHWRRTFLAWEICALCDMGRISDAKALQKEFERLVPDHQKALRKNKCLCYNREFIDGKIALAERDFPRAIQDLEKGRQQVYAEENSFLDVFNEIAYVLDNLADAYFLGGRLDRAAETYGQIQQLVTGRWNWGAIYARSYYKQGKACELMGKKAEAREKYRKFLDLWKDADPGLPEVDDARSRLNALKS